MLQINNVALVLCPELLVFIALVIAIFLSTTKYQNLVWLISVFLLVVSSVYIIKFQLFLESPLQILGGMLVADKLSVLFKLIVLFVSIFIILGSVKYTEGFQHRSEFFIILLAAVLGIMFLVGANDLITLFIALETLSLSAIMLAGYSKYDTRSNEASLKYLLSSAAASSIFLFGLSLLYGLTSSTQFYEIKYKLLELYNSGNLNYPVIIVILTLIIGGLAFKLAGVPLHMWSPDVYEGAPTPVTAFLSIASKAAGVAISIRILVYLFDFAIPVWQLIIIVISVLSMVVGNLTALGEVLNKTSIKRLMAYSSIAHIGYILIGIALGTNETVGAGIFYLLVYSIMNLGAFLCIIAFGNEANSDSIKDYSGLIKKKPLLVIAFCICLFNLGGLPVPPAGFIAKFLLFKASFEAGFVGIILGIIGLLTTIISIYYYSYIAKIMIVDPPSDAVLNIETNKEALGKSNVLNFAILSAVCGIFLAVLLSNALLKLSINTTGNISNGNQVISYMHH